MTMLFNLNSIQSHSVSDTYKVEVDALFFNIKERIGQYKDKRIWAYRIPNAEDTLSNPFNQYISIIIRGENADCHLELCCSDKISEIEWPLKSDFNIGRRINIQLFDWVDIYWFINRIFKEFIGN